MADFGQGDKTPFGQGDSQTFGDEDRETLAEQLVRTQAEGARQIGGGVRDALQSGINLVEPLARKMEELVPLGSINLSEMKHEPGFTPMTLGEVEDPKGMGPALVRGVSQFLTAFLPTQKAAAAAGFGQAATKALGGGKAAKVAGTLAEGEISALVAEQIAFNPKDPRLSNLVDQYPSLRNPITDFLKASPDDTDAEDRFKMALEGLGIGILATPLTAALRGVQKGAVTATRDATMKRAIQVEELLDPAAKQVPEKAGNINLSFIDSEEGAKDAIRETAEKYASEMDVARRGTVSEEETRNLADALNMTPEDLLERRKGEAFNAETALASRELLVSSAEEVFRLSKSAVGGSDEALIALEQAKLRHMAIQEQVAGMTAEAGRALRQFQMLAAGENKAKMLKDLLASRGGRNKIEDFAQLASAIDTPEGMAKFVRESQKATTTEKLIEVWINALLSGPQTHAVNVLSNSLVSTWMIPEHFLAAGIGVFRKGDKVSFAEATSRGYGWVEGWRDGIRALGKTLKTGEPSDFFSKIETPRQGAVGGKVGEVVRLPGRFLSAEDELFKAIGYRMELRGQAMRSGINKGLKGEELARHVNDMVNNPPENLKLAAIDNARYQTFTKPLIPGGIGSSIQGVKAKHPWVSLIAPFVRTPTNIIRFAGERSVFAPAFKEFKDAWAKGGAERDLAIARMTMGSGMSATVVGLASEGYITGGGPVDPRARAAKFDTGWKPYSIKVGDEYYAYNRLEPLGMLFGAAADFSEIAGQANEMEADKLAAAIAFSVTRNLTSKTWLSGISDLVEATTDPERYGEKYVQRLAGTLVPTGVAQYTRTQDPVLRDVQTALDAIKSRLPGYSETIPARRNLWGEPIMLGGGLGPDMISPIYTSTQRHDPVRDEIVDLELNLSMPRRNINGVDLSPQQYAEFVELAGIPAKKQLDVIVNQPSWKDIPASMRESLIRGVISTNRNAARALMQVRYKDQLLVGPAKEKAQELRSE